MKLERYLRWIFLDPAGTLRSGWRFAVFFIAFLFLAAALGGAAQVLLARSGIRAYPGSMEFAVINGVLSLVAALLVGWQCGKYFEGLPFKALGAAFTRFWHTHLVQGLVSGAVTIVVAVLIAAVFGGLRFSLNSDDPAGSIIRSMGVSLAVFAVAAAFEEALFRGYILQTFNRSGLGWLAILLTSCFFGFAHLSNPNAGTLSTVNTILAGVWFGVAYLKTRDLWFVWGMHLIWNWLQGAVFGIEVSGITEITASPLMKEMDKGPTWLTGESYGIEGGIACTVALLLSTLAIHYLPFIRTEDEMLALTSPRTQSKNA